MKKVLVIALMTLFSSNIALAEYDPPEEKKERVKKVTEKKTNKTNKETKKTTTKKVATKKEEPKQKDLCSHLYVGKVVVFSYPQEIGDFWLGYKTEYETGYGTVIGIGKNVATINVTKARAHPSGAHEFQCDKLFSA